MGQVQTDKRLVQLISIIHDVTVGKTGREDRRADFETKKPFAVFQCNKFMKVVDRADKYISYYSVLRKTVKWPKVSAELCALVSAFLCTKHKQK